MNRVMKHPILASILALGAMFAGLAGYDYYAAKPAHASAGDSLQTFFGNGSSVATVITGVTSRKIIVKQLIITSASSGTVYIQEDPSSGSNTNIVYVGLLANVPYEIPNSLLQTSTDGYVLGSGSGLAVVNQGNSSSNLSITVRYALN